MEGDRKRTIERRKILEKIVRDAFPGPGKEVTVIREEEYPGDGPNKWRIRIRETKVPNRRLVLFPTEEFMTDVGIPFDERVNEAIELAKQRLTLSHGGFLGKIILKTTEIEWEAKKEQ